MRVIHVITRLIVGGAQENTIASVLGLAKKPGIQISLLSGPTTGPEGSLEKSVAPHLRIVPELVRAIHPLRDHAALHRLEEIFRKEKPDIVHTHSGKAGLLGRIAAARAGVPVVIHTIHGPSFGAFQDDTINFFLCSAERYAGRRTTHFVAVAKAMSDQYLAAGIGHFSQYSKIFSGFPLEPFLAAKDDPALRERLGLDPQDIVIGKVARLFKLKGHHDLLAAAPALVRQNPRLKFLLVGDGAWRGRFERIVRRRRLEKNFIFTGLIPPAQMPAYIGIMDILVHLSRREGLARALPQALAAGKPVIATDCDGAREVCRHLQTGFLVNPGDRAQLIRSVQKLSTDAALRREYGECGRAFVRENFSVERMVDELHALYLRLVSHTPSR